MCSSKRVIHYLVIFRELFRMTAKLLELEIHIKVSKMVFFKIKDEVIGTCVIQAVSIYIITNRCIVHIRHSFYNCKKKYFPLYSARIHYHYT